MVPTFTLTHQKIWVYLYVLWPETLKYLSLYGNLVINPCLVAPSDNLYLMNSETIQSIDVCHVDHLVFKIHFVFNSERDTYLHSVEKLSFSLTFLLFKVGGMRGNIINLLFCGLLVQKAGRLSLNSMINEYPERIPCGQKEHSLKRMISRSLSIFEIKRLLPALYMGESRGVISGKKYVFPSSVRGCM